ncbi:probable YqaJ family viral recombinase [Mycoplasma suis KI3806]|uniref:Probable YqaJ family viral recombinase n=1 Tax=Mycoplasma suis (strain KI_3806) TaxID=708248 RepID=F0V3I4_MYCS3|nr:YqaJ viral recombinase family protein [Mycoplasma suis]CBZ40406.1 probable YqaJ family viral recombinase [Mycoplasma suis KI3806]
MKFKNYSYPEDFYFTNDQISLTKLGRMKSIKFRKKITGSRIAAVLGRNKYKTPFQIWCEILGFVESDIEPYFANAGVIIEKSLLTYAKRELRKHFRTYNPQEVKYDIFPDNEIFGGIPDGEEFEGDNIKSILEIKTTPLDSYLWTFKNNEFQLVKDSKGIPIIKEYKGNIHKWFAFSESEIRIPEEYQYQLALYLYLRGIEKGYFCVGFLNQSHYLRPENYSPIPKRELGKENPQVVVIQEMNIDLKEFEKVIKYAEEWYKKYVMRGISPPLTPKDLNWIRFGFPSL